MTFWRLQPFVHVADVGGDLVFLDARANQYSCLTRSDAPAFHDLLVHGDGHSEAAMELALDLEAMGMLLPCDESAGWAGTQLRAKATRDFHDVGALDLRAGCGAVWRLALSVLGAALMLHASRPSKWLRPPKAGSEVSVTRVCTLALQFDRLRPWVPRSGRCLPNSLLLLGYLRRHDITASLVFGVRTFPFEAHCWVEYRGAVLNDTLEHISWFTPIAVA